MFYDARNSCAKLWMLESWAKHEVPEELGIACPFSPAWRDVVLQHFVLVFLEHWRLKLDMIEDYKII